MSDFYDISEDDFEVKPTHPDFKESLDKYYHGIGGRLKEARIEEGYTLDRLARELGLGATAISNYEAGIRQIPVHILVDLCDILGRPFQYFLGPVIEPNYLLTKEIKKTIDRFTSSTYIESIYELKDGSIVDTSKPLPLLPFPPAIVKGGSFVIRDYKKEAETYNYYVFKWYTPTRKKGILKRGQREYLPPAPDDWVLAEIGDTKKCEITQFKNIKHSGKKKFKDDKTINIRAILIAKVERMVK